MSGDAVSRGDGARRGVDSRRSRRSPDAISTRQIVRLVATIMGFITMITLLTFLLSFVVFLVAS